MGLKEDIRKAESEELVANLLRQGCGYKSASPKTRRQWQRIAKARVAEIQRASLSHKVKPHLAKAFGNK